MKKLIALASIALSLSGCAASKGFLTGVVGGPLAVDEVTHEEGDIKSIHSIAKVGTHQALMISTAFVLWPLAASYGLSSGIYGAYEFIKYEKKEEAKSAEVK